MKARYFLLALLAAPLCHAVDDDTPKDDPKLQLWQAKLDDTSLITLAVQQIVSVTMHPYLLNGENLVTEVTIDTAGNNSIRFYYVHSAEEKADITDPESLVKSAKKRLTQAPSQPKASEKPIASLKFPEGVYAHTIEYQVGCFKTLEAIYKSITSVWERASKRRTVFKVDVND